MQHVEARGHVVREEGRVGNEPGRGDRTEVHDGVDVVTAGAAGEGVHDLPEVGEVGDHDAGAATADPIHRYCFVPSFLEARDRRSS